MDHLTKAKLEVKLHKGLADSHTRMAGWHGRQAHQCSSKAALADGLAKRNAQSMQSLHEHYEDHHSQLAKFHKAHAQEVNNLIDDASDLNEVDSSVVDQPPPTVPPGGITRSVGDGVERWSVTPEPTTTDLRKALARMEANLESRASDDEGIPAQFRHLVGPRGEDQPFRLPAVNVNKADLPAEYRHLVGDRGETH